RNGKPIGFLTPEKRQHVDGLGRPTSQPSTEPAIMSMLREDLYGVLGGTVAGTEQAVFRFTINPLVWWVWYGGMIVALGGLIVMWPGGGSPAARRAQAGYAGRLGGEGGKAGHDARTPRCTGGGGTSWRSVPWGVACRFGINARGWWVWYGGMIVALGGLIVMWRGGGSPAARRAQAGYAVRLVGEEGKA